MSKPNLGWMKKNQIAHRGLHNPESGPLENSLGAFRAAVEKSFSIECDLQISGDGVPIVFHDDTLERLTSETGSVRTKTAAELSEIKLGNTDDTIPTLRDMLNLVEGKSGLVIELKGIKGKDEGFAAAVLNVLDDYDGPVALMSFDHWLLEDARKAGCKVPLGLTAEGDESSSAIHQGVFEQNKLDFISYNIRDLPNSFVREKRAHGKPVICWTVRDLATMVRAYKYCDQITFEGFDPRLFEKT